MISGNKFRAVLFCFSVCACAWAFASQEPSKSSEPKKLKFFVFTEECFDTLLVQQNFFEQACLKQVISKGLGYAIVVGSGILKLPQIQKILASGSVKGLSSTMFYTESLAQLLHVCYNVLLAYPFSVFGESVIILVQNFVIIGMIWKLAKPSYSILHMGSVVAIAAVSVGVCLFSLPAQYRPFIVIASISIGSFGRLPQIYTNYVSKSTGQLSVITIFLTFAGSASRVFTSLADVSDLVMASGFLFSCFMNFVIFVQIVLYWGGDSKKSSSKPASKPASANTTTAASATKKGSKKRD
eukprot:c7646_g1_i1.p1 GENE.c7646_g1_i1~~c7646_g1_i1.p1  ORF type:complete len:311 (-),score=68.72 c7646_g1_i1:194-1084(-)